MLIFDLILATRRRALTGVERYGINLFEAVRRMRPESLAFVHDPSLFADQRGLVTVAHVYRGWFLLPQDIRRRGLAPEAVIFPTAPASPLFHPSENNLCRIAHDVFPWSWERPMPWKGRLLYRYGENLMARRYDRFLGTTQPVADDLRALFARSDIDWCGNAPGLDVNGPERRPDGAPDAFILVVGTVEPRKGYDRLADLVEKAPDGAPPIVLVGRPGWGEIVARMDALALRKPTRFIWLRDLQDDGLRWLGRNASCFLSLSLAEGFNMPLVECAINGRAILCSDIPVHRSVAPPWAAFVGRDMGADRIWAALRAATPPEGAQIEAYVRRYSWESVAARLINIVAPRPFEETGSPHADLGRHH
ncbi:glycosyltransferase [Methylocystis sp. JAN1]|uniref:glycosyltransferase n=1 Tax=Methylocystis sp. JAN1 TaxID=3397211 RepID=UPI003FA278CD